MDGVGIVLASLSLLFNPGEAEYVLLVNITLFNPSLPATISTAVVK